MSANKVQARRSIVNDLRRFMVGPASGESETIRAGRRVIAKDGSSRVFLDQSPADFYHTGMLWPPHSEIDDEEDEQDDQGGDGEAGSGDSVMVLANVSQQAAIGITFQVADTKVSLTAGADWGIYTLEETPGLLRDAGALTGSGTSGGQSAMQGSQSEDSGSALRWRRDAVHVSAIFAAADLPENAPRLLVERDGVELRIRRRSVGSLSFLTLSLVSRRSRISGPTVGTADFRVYQPRLSVQSESGESVFVANVNTARRKDSDFWQQELLYREVRQFAVGHGIAAAWEAGRNGRAQRIWSEWIPEYEVPKASATVPELPEIRLDAMGDPRQEKAAFDLMRQLEEAYESWIRQRHSEVDGIIEHYEPLSAARVREAASVNLAECDGQLLRIAAGITYLETHPVAMQAFQLANRAMALSMRRARSEVTPTWFPFQLAFMLVALPSLADRTHPERSIFDLIWFPTGGGKTEAYLGLSAFALFHRCLTASTAEQADGTAIITRYTLRTLTVQQFERTAIAVMACESVRREHPQLRTMRPWSIGLLVGSGATPKWLRRRWDNDNASAEALLRSWGPGSRGSLLPLKKCPWCETPLEQGSLKIESAPERLTTQCLNKECEFSTGIPIAIVDEHITSVPPSFVVATIDKFAQLAWEPTLSRLLGVGTPARPPDMIIQDELHLITDSLGTVAGLYETAIDRLATCEGVGPKIIGATATIRRAPSQIMSLFLRRTRQFPPSGLRHDDSFFYRQEVDPEVAGRLYVGVHAQGRSPKHTLPRVIAGVLQSAQAVPDVPSRDDYWTLVCYFNSLRELGGALVIAEDDVRAFQKVLAKTEGHKVRPISQLIEMTSQVPSYRIPEILDQLKTSISGGSGDSEPIDLLFATNMISVGVDVGRLGAMVIAGQPKTTAEYIQASSRVGRPRGSAGLVIIQYNWTRPRDRSHYERFIPYHAAFYRFVEAATVTPFAPRARDKALRGALVSLARSLSFDPGENRIPRPAATAAELLKSLGPVIDAFADRVREVDPREANSTRAELLRLAEDLNQFLQARDSSPVFWTSWRVPAEERRNAAFVLTDGEADHEGLWTAMLSMRTTDQPTLLVLDEDSGHV
jgi:hypothetical protein